MISQKPSALILAEFYCLIIAW